MAQRHHCRARATGLCRGYRAWCGIGAATDLSRSCRAADLNRGHQAAGALINANLGMAVLLLVSVVHSITMIEPAASWPG